MRTPRPLPRRAHGSALLVLLALVLGLAGAPASAQDPAPNGSTATEPADPDAPPPTSEALLKTLALEPDDLPPSPDDPFMAVVDADRVVFRTERAQARAFARSARANADSKAAALVRQAAYAKALVAQKARDDAGHELSTERKRLSDLTVRAFVRGGETEMENLGDVLAGDTSDPAAGRQILFTQVLERQRRVTDKARSDLNVAKRKLTKAKSVLDAATADADRKAAKAADAADKLTKARDEHREALDGAAEARTELRSKASGPVELVPQEVALIGLPRLTADDLAGWFARSAYRPRVSTPIEDYAEWFIEEGAAEGIRGDIAFAQAVLETGGFANTDSVVANNFSGIGHCDLCPSGWTFPSPRMGVRAQIQLLKSYAVKKPEYASKLVDKRLRGPAGCCPTWGDLTTVWATDPGYGPKVMLIYTSIVDFALQRRAAGEGFDSTAPTA